MTNLALKNITEAPVVANARESAGRIWLAGLGALSKTQAEGQKWFEAMVEEGKKVEERAKHVAADTVDEAKGKVVEFRGKANEQLDRLEELFQERVAQVLHKMGIPTQDDIQELTKRVAELNESVVALKK